MKDKFDSVRSVKAITLVVVGITKDLTAIQGLFVRRCNVLLLKSGIVRENRPKQKAFTLHFKRAVGDKTEILCFRDHLNSSHFKNPAVTRTT